MMEKKWTVYILQCRDGTLYTGITDDLLRRLKAHESGRGAKYTRGRGPFRVCYAETVPDKPAALKRECFIKRLRKKEKMALIQENKRNHAVSLAFDVFSEYTDGKKTDCATVQREEERTT